jgi:hypothetical protein
VSKGREYVYTGVYFRSTIAFAIFTISGTYIFKEKLYGLFYGDRRRAITAVITPRFVLGYDFSLS